MYLGCVIFRFRSSIATKVSSIEQFGRNRGYTILQHFQQHSVMTSVFLSITSTTHVHNIVQRILNLLKAKVMEVTIPFINSKKPFNFHLFLTKYVCFSRKRRNNDDAPYVINKEQKINGQF